MSGLCFGGMMALMQIVMFYVLFLSPEPYPMSIFWRIITYVFILIINLGWSIESIIKEIREHNLIKAIKELK